MLPSHRDEATIPLTAMGSDDLATGTGAGIRERNVHKHHDHDKGYGCGPDCNITDLTINIPGSTRRAGADDPPPARWRTPEFMFYGLVFAIVVPMLIWWPIKLSSCKLKYLECVADMQLRAPTTGCTRHACRKGGCSVGKLTAATLSTKRSEATSARCSVWVLPS